MQDFYTCRRLTSAQAKRDYPERFSNSGDRHPRHAKMSLTRNQHFISTNRKAYYMRIHMIHKYSEL
jgi:hypothetical protein